MKEQASEPSPTLALSLHFHFPTTQLLSLPSGLCPHFPTALCWFLHLLMAPSGGHVLAEGSSDFSHGSLYPGDWLGGHVVAFASWLACLLSEPYSLMWVGTSLPGPQSLA